jgi:putative sigma-54 modulation protein
MQLNVTFRHMDSSDFLREYAREKVERVNKLLDRAGEASVVFSLERHLHHADITIASGRFVLRGHEKSEDMYASIDLAMDKIERQLRRYKEKLKHHHGRAFSHHNESVLGRMKARHAVVEIPSPELEGEAMAAAAASSGGGASPANVHAEGPGSGGVNGLVNGQVNGLVNGQVNGLAHGALNGALPPSARVVSTTDLSVQRLAVDEAAMQLDLMNSEFLVFQNAVTGEVNVLYRRKEDGKYGLIEAHVTR